MAVTINGSGQVPVQVVQTIKTDTFTTASTSMVDITGLSVNITPTNASNKVLITYSVQMAGTSGEYTTQFQLVRNSTAICIGDTNGSRARVTNANRSTSGGSDQSWVVSNTFIDSPATTSSVTYKVQGLVQSGGTLFINRTSNWPDASTSQTTTCTITVMEISG